jgi:hypothetical protein
MSKFKPAVRGAMLLLAAATSLAARAEMSAEELAKLAQNPVGNLISVPFRTTPISASGRRAARRTS